MPSPSAVFTAASAMLVVLSATTCLNVILFNNTLFNNGLVLCLFFTFMLMLSPSCHSSVPLGGDDYNGLRMFSEYIMQCNKSSYLSCAILPPLFLVNFATLQVAMAMRVPSKSEVIPVLAGLSVIGLSMVLVYNHRVDGDVRYTGHIIGVVFVAAALPIQMLVIACNLYEPLYSLEHYATARRVQDEVKKAVDIMTVADAAEYLAVIVSIISFIVFLSWWSSGRSEAIMFEYVWVISVGALFAYHVNKNPSHYRTPHPTAFAGLILALIAASAFWILP